MRKTLPLLAVVFVTCTTPEPKASSDEPILAAPSDIGFVLHGTVVNENGHSLRNAKLMRCFRSVSEKGWSQFCLGFVETDDQGRFQVSYCLTVGEGNGHSQTNDGVCRFWDAPGSRRCFFLELADGSALTDLVDLGRRLEPGKHFAGELVLAPPGDERLLRRLSDPSLMDRYQKMVALGDARRLEGCMGEMARRGGTRWRAHLEKELSMWDATKPNLSLLTALRRTERLVDPLILDFDGPTEVSCTRDQLPTLRFHLRNQDAKELAVRIQSPWEFAVVPTVPDSNVVKVRPDPVSKVGSPSLSIQTIWPGNRQGPMFISLQNFVQIHAPGRYELRILYHANPLYFTLPYQRETITESENVRGFICASSKPFTLIVTK